jgi:hypothetical protein
VTLKEAIKRRKQIGRGLLELGRIHYNNNFSTLVVAEMPDGSLVLGRQPGATDKRLTTSEVEMVLPAEVLAPLWQVLSALLEGRKRKAHKATSKKRKE